MITRSSCGSIISWSRIQNDLKSSSERSHSKTLYSTLKPQSRHRRATFRRRLAFVISYAIKRSIFLYFTSCGLYESGSAKEKYGSSGHTEEMVRGFTLQRFDNCDDLGFNDFSECDMRISWSQSEISGHRCFISREKIFSRFRFQICSAIFRMEFKMLFSQNPMIQQMHDQHIAKRSSQRFNQIQNK